MKATGPTDPNVRRLIVALEKKAKAEKANIWLDISERLKKPRRRRVTVNLSRINRCTRDGEVIVVPGKVLGSGFLDHKLCIAALSFSESAIKKTRSAGGECISIKELMKRNPKGSNVKIIT
ncbi:MAG: 50S ribosomal protein L18e [Candidatus Freyarchaeota archaeon]|nr:50S ribosomal protein L18e [Candidatus Jordarchaeia archaeon]